jgi:hypothetical protein
MPLPPQRPVRVLFVGKPAIAARARVFLDERTLLKQAYEPTPDALRQADVVLIHDAQALGPEWLPVDDFMHGFRGFAAPEALKAAAHGELTSFLQSHRGRITVAVRRDAADLSLVRTASWAANVAPPAGAVK